MSALGPRRTLATAPWIALFGCMVAASACRPPPDTSEGRRSAGRRGSAGTSAPFDVEDPTTIMTRREVGNLVFEGVPETPPELRENLRRYQNVRPAAFEGWSKAGVLISTRFGETAQVHEVDKPGGARDQLTFFDEPVAWVSVSPRGDRFAFGQDAGGNEQWQGFLFELRTHDVVRYTVEGTRNGAPVWSEDGTTIAWEQATASDPNRKILSAVIGSPVETRKVAYEGKGATYPLSFSPSKKKLLLGRYLSITRSERILLDVGTGETVRVNVGGPVAWGGGVMLDDRRFVAISDKGSDFRRLVRVDAVSGRVRVLDPDTKWDVEVFAVSPNRRTVAYAINAGGASQIYSLDIRSGRARTGPDIGMSVVRKMAFSPDGRQVGFGFTGSSHPGDAWSFATRSPEVQRWTEGEVGGLDREGFAEPKIVSVQSGTVSVPAFVYMPSGDGPHPVIMDIHGGPEGQERPTFNATIQHWVNELGVAVVAPNVRGSSGYGKAYVKMDNGLHRMKSVEDIGMYLDWIAREEQLDADRVVLYGGSYGGFMVLAAMEKYAERIAGGVDIVGISDFKSFLTNTKGYRRDLRRAEYGDERDPAVAKFFEEISPLGNADKITKPLFVVQGENDPRVPATEAEQIVDAVRGKGGVAWYMLARDEGHGFRKKSNRAALREAVTIFLGEVLKL
ncbi:MAG: alpha/beta fold hydrolase [Myxococcota bacterium]